MTATWSELERRIRADGVLLAGALSAGKLRDAVGAGNIDRYLLPVVGMIVLISVLPLLIEVRRGRRRARQARAARLPEDAR